MSVRTKSKVSVLRPVIWSEEATGVSPAISEVNTQISLHLYTDGQHQGMASHNVKQPCFTLFELCGPHTKVCGFLIHQKLQMKFTTMTMRRRSMCLCL